MYLTCTLLETAPTRGYYVSCPKPDPDNLIEHNGKRIWVEAITATSGDPSSSDSLAERVDTKMSAIPTDKIILRYANAIITKHLKYKEYLAKGIVSDADLYVVALNGWSLGYSWASGEIPRFLKALFPFGALGYAIDPKSMQLVDKKYEFQPLIRKTNGSTVSTEIFFHEIYRGLSAVLYSEAHAFMTMPFGTDFEVAHNPTAMHPLPTKLFPSNREWTATFRDGTYELTSQNHRKSKSQKK